MALAAVGLPGCFYLGPIVPEDLNRPPTVVASYPAEGEPLVLDLSQKVAYVLVSDANDIEDLEFRWTIADFGIQGDATPIQGRAEVGSQLAIARNPDYDGRPLSVRVTDGYGEALTLEWILSVPEVAP